MPHIQSVEYLQVQKKQSYKIQHLFSPESLPPYCQMVLRRNLSLLFQLLPAIPPAISMVYKLFDIADIDFPHSMSHLKYENIYYHNQLSMYPAYMSVF